MGGTPNVVGMISDPDFQGLAPADKRTALGKLTGDKSFAALSDAETIQFVSRMTPQQTPEQQAPNALAQAQQTIKTLPSGFPTTFGDRLRASQLPGSFEGKPENVGSYLPQSLGQMATGAGNIAQGNVAKGGSQIIQGAGNALLPLAPFAVAGAPVAAATATALGAGVGYGGKKVSEMLGANPDQAQLVSDIGNVLGGLGGAAGMPMVRAGIAKAAYTSAGELTPAFDALLHPTKITETMFRAIFKEPPSYPGASQPLAEDFYAQKAADLMRREVAQRILDSRAASAARAEAKITAAQNKFVGAPPNPKGVIVEPSSIPPAVKVTYQSVPGKDLLPMVMKGDRGAILEWQRRGLQLPQGAGLMVESTALNKAWKGYK